MTVLFPENYQKLELEKKKARSQKVVYKGPIIRYQSVTMPLIEELPDDINVDEEGSVFVHIAKKIGKLFDEHKEKPKILKTG